MKQMLVFSLCIFFLTGCAVASAQAQANISPIPTPTPAWMAALEPAAEDGVRFLKSQYNADVGLLQESPTIGANRYFLANDALLTAYVFDLYGENDLVGSLRRKLALYQIKGNDFIEAAWGVPIPWPPYHFQDPGTPVTTYGDAHILTIAHNGPGYFYDWSAYANLACMAAVNEYNQGYSESARRLYQIQMSTFDGQGFPDLAYQTRDGVYETLGVAWCAYAGALLRTPDARLFAVLLDQQDPVSGGIHTHYQADAPHLADPNVETTALSLLAFHTAQNGPPHRLGLGQ